MYYSFFHCYINGNAFLFHRYFSEIPLFLRQIGMYFIYETCNKYLHLNCHHFKNTKIAYYISVNVIISLTNSSLATIFPQFVTTYHQKNTLLHKKNLSYCETSKNSEHFDFIPTGHCCTDQSCLLGKFKIWQKPSSHKLCTLAVSIFFLQLNKPLL